MNNTFTLLHRRLSRAMAAAALTLLAPLAQASLVHQQGQFLNDDDLFTLDFSLSQSSNWDVSSTSYASGGFAPVLALFMQGNLIQLSAGSSNTCGPGSSPDPVSGFCWDAAMHMLLGAGDYTLVLSQDGNLPLGSTLAEGYSQAGQNDYTGLWYLGMSDMRFTQVDGMQRSGAWAFDMQTATVPEPAPVALLLAALAALGWSRSSRRLAQPGRFA